MTTALSTRDQRPPTAPPGSPLLVHASRGSLKLLIGSAATSMDGIATSTSSSSSSPALLRSARCSACPSFVLSAASRAAVSASAAFALSRLITLSFASHAAARPNAIPDVIALPMKTPSVTDMPACLIAEAIRSLGRAMVPLTASATRDAITCKARRPSSSPRDTQEYGTP